VFPGIGKSARIAQQLIPGVYLDHEGNCYEHEPEWTLTLGTISRVGDTPLLTKNKSK
jgi:hypothetical protein